MGEVFCSRAVGKEVHFFPQLGSLPRSGAVGSGLWARVVRALLGISPRLTVLLVAGAVEIPEVTSGQRFQRFSNHGRKMKPRK